MSEKIEITPTWSGLLPAMLSVLEDNRISDGIKDGIRIEMQQMARAADAYNRRVRMELAEIADKKKDG